jgi:hypothetical protein
VTPPAVTEAGRNGTATRGAPDRGAPERSAPERGATGSPPRKGSSSGHRRRLSLPKVPRRISGPSGGPATSKARKSPKALKAPKAPKTPKTPRGRSAAAAPTTAPNAETAPAPTTPRRPEPAHAPRRSRTTRRRPSSRRAPTPGPRLGASVSARLQAFVRALPDHPLLDRIIRGRAWIPLLGVLLAGIVAMQVEVLKLNASVGRSLERGTALQSRNELLRANVASLSDDQRIERLAASMGMIMPGPTQIAFLSSQSGGRVGAAIKNIHPIDPGNFLNITSAKGDVVTTAGALAAMQPSTPGG